MIVIFHGSNRHAKDILLTKLKDQYQSFSFIEMDCEDKNEVTKASIDLLLSSSPLLGSPQRLILFQNFTEFSDPDYWYVVAKRYQKDSDTIVILHSNEKLRSNAKIFTFAPPKSIYLNEEYSRSELMELIKRKLQEQHIPNVIQVASHIIDVVDQDPYVIEHEIEKLGLYYQEYETLDTVDEILIKSVHATIWQYLQALTKGDRKNAIAILLNLFTNGENEYALLAMITWNLRLLAVVASGILFPDMQIVKKFGYSPYSVKQAREVIGKFPLIKISLLYGKVVELEYKMKTGVIEPRLGLILLSFAF